VPHQLMPTGRGQHRPTLHPIIATTPPSLPPLPLPQAAYYSEAQDRFLFEWGVVYKRTLGAYRGTYNVHYVRDGLKGPVLAKRVVKLDKPDRCGAVRCGGARGWVLVALQAGSTLAGAGAALSHPPPSLRHISPQCVLSPSTAPTPHRSPITPHPLPATRDSAESPLTASPNDQAAYCGFIAIR